jgi:phospholipase/carboxylesterase
MIVPMYQEQDRKRRLDIPLCLCALVSAQRSASAQGCGKKSPGNKKIMHAKKIITAGKELGQAKKALVMLHGRGATAQGILGVADHLSVADFALVAPQATNFTWYPYSFLAPPRENEPWLSSAIDLVNATVEEIRNAGIADENIFFTGFSQGACLTLEYAARHAQRWGGIAAFTGGLIGDRIYREKYRGDFAGTPVFIGSGDPDPHVPPSRVRETTAMLRELNADVTEKLYPAIGHTITPEELNSANELIFAP